MVADIFNQPPPPAATIKKLPTTLDRDGSFLKIEVKLSLPHANKYIVSQKRHKKKNTTSRII